MTATAEQTGTWLAEFTAQPKAEPWIQSLRDGAFERFAEAGIPYNARRRMALHQRRTNRPRELAGGAGRSASRSLKQHGSILVSIRLRTPSQR